ncbi:translation initiation factor IF-2 [Chelonia mydas]|uniref:translation initiation factor IF-2 n=1 Tax=Chelonia mydas TaxID=8469 RepID=UPI001CA87EE1|nr:translation initiation factor IF-2 [Chelonia mydas]
MGSCLPERRAAHGAAARGSPGSRPEHRPPGEDVTGRGRARAPSLCDAPALPTQRTGAGPPQAARPARGAPGRRQAQGQGGLSCATQQERERSGGAEPGARRPQHTGPAARGAPRPGAARGCRGGGGTHPPPPPAAVYLGKPRRRTRQGGDRRRSGWRRVRSRPSPPRSRQLPADPTINKRRGPGPAHLRAVPPYVGQTRQALARHAEDDGAGGGGGFQTRQFRFPGSDSLARPPQRRGRRPFPAGHAGNCGSPGDPGEVRRALGKTTSPVVPRAGARCAARRTGNWSSTKEDRGLAVGELSVGTVVPRVPRAPLGSQRGVGGADFPQEYTCQRNCYAQYTDKGKIQRL